MCNYDFFLPVYNETPEWYSGNYVEHLSKGEFRKKD
jgi:hypothetical protein